MGGCFSTANPSPNSAPELPNVLPTNDVTSEDLVHDTRLELAAQQHESQNVNLVTEQQLQESLSKWQQEHVNQSTQLQQLITLQSQEITKLREQVIDLQAFRQQQQIQYQRATYIKSQMFPAVNSHNLRFPPDCCAAAMACCLALEEIRADLKTEGLMISKQLEALSSLGNSAGHMHTASTKLPFSSTSTFASVSPPDT